MFLYLCKCLNVTVKSDKVEENVDTGKLDLTQTEQRDIFFNEKHVLSEGSMLVSVAQPSLTGQRAVGRWIIYFCFVCNQTTHAIMQNSTKLALICKALQTTMEWVNNLKKSSNFSPVFNLILPESASDFEMKENIDTSNVLISYNKVRPTPQALGTLNKHLHQALQLEIEAIEESVRQFRDQKYAEFEAFRERAQRDHKILTSIINKTRCNIDADGNHMDTGIDNSPPSPQLPPLQRRRLSSMNDAKKNTHNHPQPTQRSLPPEEDSLDAEDIFDLEGMDSHHDMGSDQDDYDSDNSCSHDEGIQIARGRAHYQDMARSLPINIAKFPQERPLERELEDDDEPSQDIAASIKALAKSVHGDAFELPRPRFSTRI